MNAHLIKRNPEYVTSRVTLSHSSIVHRLRACPRLLELNKLYGHRRAEREESIPTGAGEALHRAWQYWMATNDKVGAAWQLLSNYPMSLQRSHFDYRSVQACYSTFEEMIAHPLTSKYQLAFIRHEGIDKPAIEVPFRIHFPGVHLYPHEENPVPFVFDGFIDAILFDVVKQRYVVVDIKTTRKDRRDYSTMYMRDTQCLPYAYVLEKALGQPADSISVIYLVAYIDILNPRVLKYEFEKSLEEIQQWAFVLAFEIRQIQQYAAMGFFPKFGEHCDTYGPCVYNDVCDFTTPQGVRDMLRQQFGDKDENESVLPDFKPWFEIDLTIEGLSS